MSKILITGSSGQLGCELHAIQAKYPMHEMIFMNRKDLDVAKESSIYKITSIQPDCIINAAAYTAVDKAEADLSNAQATNAQALKYLSLAANQCAAVLIHISTDYVYHLEKQGPLMEVDPTLPQGVYALTKKEGEDIALALCKRPLIVRTSWLYSSYGNNFVKTMLKLAETKSELTIVADQIGSPTYAADLAEALMTMVEKIDPSFNQWGIYNYSNEGLVSWYDFASAIFEISGKEIILHKTSTKAYNAPAPRPLWSVLSKNKIKSIFGIKTNHWRASLIKCMDKINLVN